MVKTVQPISSLYGKLFQLLLVGVYLNGLELKHVIVNKTQENIQEYQLKNGNGAAVTLYDGLNGFHKSQNYDDYIEQVEQSSNIVEALPLHDNYDDSRWWLSNSAEESNSNAQITVSPAQSMENYFQHNQYSNSNTKTHRNKLLTTTGAPNKIQDTLKNNSPTTAMNYNRNTLPKCPDGLTYFESTTCKPSCFLITEPTTYPPSCPYPGNIEYYFLQKQYLVNVTNVTVWAFAQRNNSNAFGKFHWQRYIHMHDVKDAVEEYINNNRSIKNKNCLVISGKKLLTANCDEKYPGICVYSYDDPSITDYCKRRFNESCVSSYLGSVSKCYCKIETQIKKPRSEFCTKLAELKYPYQNRLLLHQLNLERPCWIGLHRNHNNTYQWESAMLLNYTYWSESTDFQKSYGATDKNGWTLQNEGSLTCSICEINVEENLNVSLTLKHNKSNGSIELQISNAINVFQGVICFTWGSMNFINLSDNKQNHVVKMLRLPNDVVNYMWCKSLQLPQFTPVYSNIILTNTINCTYGHEYAVQLIHSEHIDPHLDSSLKKKCEIKNNILRSSRFIKVQEFKEEEGSVEVLCHLTTVPSKRTISEEYQVLSKFLKSNNITFSSFASSQACLPSVTSSGDINLHWPETKIGVTTLPDKLCLQENEYPVTRTCSGDFLYGAKWLPVNGTCSKKPTEPITQALDRLLHSDFATNPNITGKLLQITQNENSMNNLSVHLISKVLEKISDYFKDVNIEVVVDTISNIMKFEENALKGSQEVLNSTDIILWNFDNILRNTETSSTGYIEEVSDKLLVQVSDLTKTDVTGIKVRASPTTGFDVNNVAPLRTNASHHDLIEEDLEVALIFPQQLYNDVMKCLGSKDDPNIITSVFYDDALFNEYERVTGYCENRIMSVLIPGFNCSFTAPLQVLFKNDNKNNTKCASWVYGTNELLESIHGYWEIDGDPIFIENTSYQICEYTHVTHFTLLVVGAQNNSISAHHKKALDIITAVGSALSILGLIIVLLTAILFKSYRVANGIVINFSVAMTAQIVLLFIADSVGQNDVTCIICGAALHYIVLAQFCWMLTIALLQYQRYVVIFSNPQTHIVAKSCAFAWGVPLLPIIIILSISTDNYGLNAHGLCYALGNSFIFGVLVPVALIIFINLIVFLRIMISVVSSRRIKVHQDKNGASKLQLRLAFMLYFLLGLTWGFGLLAATGSSLVYSYLFCLTATLQGFMLFLFFIVLNEKTRMLWYNIRYCCYKSDKYDVNQDSSTSVMMRRPKTISSDTCTDSTNSEMLRRYQNRTNSEF